MAPYALFPAAFHEELEHTRDPDSNVHIRCYPDESRAVTIELPAGGALFFAYGTPHATGANTTDHERAGVALHFINDATQSHFNISARPILTGDEASGGLKEYGVRVAGTWEQQVERVLREAAVAA
jgi:ectoine hydroxylase-related dioxygenase (phytanoyl-CoA dioxygenase family)